MTNPQRTTCGVFTVLAISTSFAAGPGIARAHGIFLHVRVEGEVIQGKAEYVDGGPIADAAVTVYAPSGRRLGGAKTNDAGEFTFTPQEVVDHRFRLDAGAGHGAEQLIAAADLPGSLLAADGGPSDTPVGRRTKDEGRRTKDDEDGSPPAVTPEISRQIGALTEEVARLGHSIRVRDILGGIGYIFGLTGLWFYLKARHRPRE